MPTVLDSYGPFASGGGIITTIAQWEEMAVHWLKDGVVIGETNELAVYADASGMNVHIKTGKSFLRGHFGRVGPAEKTLAITAASSSLNRIDRIVLRLNTSAQQLELDVLPGAAGASPSPPAITQSPTTWEISLAQVYVAAGVTTIAPGAVTDERTFARPHGAYVGMGGYTIDTAVPDSAHIFLQGQALSRITYAELFGRIGTTHGAGDGSTTFNVADMRQRVAVGFDPTGAAVPFNAVGKRGGSITTTLSLANLPAVAMISGGESTSHVHQVGTRTYPLLGGDSSPASGWTFHEQFSVTVFSDSVQTGARDTSGESVAHSHNVTLPGGGQAITILPPYVTLNYVVRAR